MRPAESTGQPTVRLRERIRRPDGLAGPRVEPRNPGERARADQLGRPLLGLIDEWRRVRRRLRARFSRDRPDGVPRSLVEGDDRAGPVLIVCHNHQVFEQNRRGSLSVLTLEAAEVCLPKLFAVEIVGQQEISLDVGKRDEHALAIDCRSCGGPTALGVLRIGVQLNRLGPNLLSRLRVEAQNRTRRPRVAGCGEKQLVAPDHRAGMPGSRHGDRPPHAVGTPGRAEALFLTDSRTVFSAEARPIVGSGRRWRGPNNTRQQPSPRANRKSRDRRIRSSLSLVNSRACSSAAARSRLEACRS